MTDVAHLLLVEDDAEIAEQLGARLRRDGYTVTVVGTGRDALEAARTVPFDLVVLDLGLPDLDGLEVCRRLHEIAPGLPVLMLTARVEEIDIVAGLDNGAQDYVAKPFRIGELLARIRAQVRTDGTAPVLDGGAIRIEPTARRAFAEDVELALSAKEFDLLTLLIREQGRVISRERIMAEVWDEHYYGTTKTLDVHVAWLRQKLGPHATAIVTVRGVGFRYEPA